MVRSRSSEIFAFFNFLAFQLVPGRAKFSHRGCVKVKPISDMIFTQSTFYMSYKKELGDGQTNNPALLPMAYPMFLAEERAIDD